MRYAIISDIHSNREALEAVLRKCGQLGVNKYICLGDIVGYNADPETCVEIVRSLNPVGMVRGNHDHCVVTDDPALTDGMAIDTLDALRWTRSRLATEDLRLLEAVPMKTVVCGTGIMLVHATLDMPEKWGYIEDEFHAELNFRHQFTRLCFYGHSHVPAMFSYCPVTQLPVASKRVDRVLEWEKMVHYNQQTRHHEKCPEDEVEVLLKPGWKYLINPGSVGQPRNGDPKASFAVYDSELQTVTRLCVHYDIPTAQDKVRQFNLGERSALRLAKGK